MKCTGKEWLTCQVEKMGCEGCYYYEEKEEDTDEQEVSEHANSEGDKTN